MPKSAWRVSRWLWSGVWVFMAFWSGFFAVLWWEEGDVRQSLSLGAEEANEGGVVPSVMTAPAADRFESPERPRVLAQSSPEPLAMPLPPKEVAASGESEGAPGGTASPPERSPWESPPEEQPLREDAPHEEQPHGDDALRAQNLDLLRSWQAKKRWVLIVRRYREEQRAEALAALRKLQKELAERDERLVWVPHTTRGRREWLLLLGPFATEVEAREALFTVPAALLVAQPQIVPAQAVKPWDR